MFQLLWSVGCEEHLHITVGFSLKTDSEWSLLCWFEQPTVIEAFTAGFKTKTDSEGPCRHRSQLGVKYYNFSLPFEFFRLPQRLRLRNLAPETRV